MFRMAVLLPLASVMRLPHRRWNAILVDLNT
jgi:hypothetical protein